MKSSRRDKINEMSKSKFSMFSLNKKTFKGEKMPVSDQPITCRSCDQWNPIKGSDGTIGECKDRRAATKNYEYCDKHPAIRKVNEV